MKAENIVTTLGVTARGQVTFRKDILKHLGIEPGDRIELDLLPNGQATLKAARRSKTVHHLLGMLAGKTTKVATLEELGEAAAQGWVRHR